MPSSQSSEKDTAQSLTDTIVKTLESKFDNRIQALEHIVLRQEEELQDAKRRLKSLGRLEQQANSMEDRIVALNRELVAKQAYLDRLGAEQGLIRQSCEQNFQAIAEEGTSQEVAIKNLQSALENKSRNTSRISLNDSLGGRYVSVDICNRMIDQEIKRTIKLMGDQFDDLASFVHSTLDCQTSLIAKVQAKLIEGAGEQCMPKGDVPNFETISRQTVTNTGEIQKLKEDHEVAIAMFVETMTSMKLKYDEIADDTKVDPALNGAGSGESKPSSNIAFPKGSEYKNDIHKIHSAIRVLSKETDAIARDSDELKEILEDAIHSLAKQSKEDADSCKRKTDELEKRLEDEFTTVLKHKDLERELKQSVMMLEEKIAFGDKSQDYHRYPGNTMIGTPTPVASNTRTTWAPSRRSRFEGELIDLTAMANVVYVE